MRSKIAGVTVAGGLLFFAVLGIRGQDSGQVEHGRYIVEQVAMCGECHTPRNDRGELDRSRWLQGAPIPLESPFENQRWAFQAPAIAGLPGWSPDEVIRILETGTRFSGKKPRSPMPGFRMNRDDASAVTAYLQSLR